MKECLRCGNGCGEDLFCQACQASLHRPMPGHESEEHCGERVKGSDGAGTLANNVISIPLQSSVVCTLQKEHNVAAHATSFSSRNRHIGVSETPALFQAHAKVQTDALGRRHQRFRYLFIGMLICAAISLIFDSILFSLVISRHALQNPVTGLQPTITCTPETVATGQITILHLAHFAAHAHILLTRDISNTLRVDSSSPLIYADSSGMVDVHVLVEDNWGMGLHYIQAEDIATHYTASTTVRVLGSDPLQPHVFASQTTINMGRDYIGANSLHVMELHNTGGGIITWRAKTDRPWLMITPMQGTFNDSQRLTVAVSRADVPVGAYDGTITLFSNGGAPVDVHVHMEVKVFPSSVDAVLVADPPVHSFQAVDGGLEPTMQTVIVRNPGQRPLVWSVSKISPTTSIDQKLPFFPQSHWLDVSPSRGVLMPGAFAALHLYVHSRHLLPGVYGGTLLLSSRSGTLNSPQQMALSVDVQSRCGTNPASATMLFSALAGQRDFTTQNFNFHLNDGCTGQVGWQAYALNDWLQVTPARGELKEHATGTVHVDMIATMLQAGIHQGFIVLVTPHRSLTVFVQAFISADPEQRLVPGTASTLPHHSNRDDRSTDASVQITPAQVDLMAYQGQADVSEQTLEIANTSPQLFTWNASIAAGGKDWLRLSDQSGLVPAHDAGHLSLTADATQLASGTYTTVVTIKTNSDLFQNEEKEHQIVVTLLVRPSCSLSVNPAQLSFHASLLSTPLAPQTLHVRQTGHCSAGWHWQATTDIASQNWLQLSKMSGGDKNDAITVTVVNAQNKLLGSYRGQIMLTAVDKDGHTLLQGVQVIPVTLTVML
ncbi:MAG TPA: hypothetical protein VL461_12965 [Dictyobacter sp.]|nr:hypothetical protein [Dictyobacter sp.]